MISFQSEKFLETKITDFLIPSEKVAHVQLDNSLEHALLVLTKSGYTAIPVLDPQFRLHGLISSPMITESILGLERIEFERLEQLKVKDVFNHKIPTLKSDDRFKKALGLLIDHPFLSIKSFLRAAPDLGASLFLTIFHSSLFTIFCGFLEV